MHASLSSVMVTLCLTDYLAPYPDVKIHVHNLGGNILYEAERMAIRAARIACTVAGTWMVRGSWARRYAPRSPIRAPVSTSVRACAARRLPR